MYNFWWLIVGSVASSAACMARRRTPCTNSNQKTICSNRYVQAIVATLVMIMTFWYKNKRNVHTRFIIWLYSLLNSLIAMATLYILDWQKRNPDNFTDEFRLVLLWLRTPTKRSLQVSFIKCFEWPMQHPKWQYRTWCDTEFDAFCELPARLVRFNVGMESNFQYSWYICFVAWNEFDHSHFVSFVAERRFFWSVKSRMAF